MCAPLRLTSRFVQRRPWRSSSIASAPGASLRRPYSKPGLPRERVFVAAPNAPKARYDDRATNEPPPKVRKTWYWVFGACSFGLAYYSVTVYLGWQAAIDKSSRLALKQDADVASRYDKIADRYDSDLDMMEQAMLLGMTRKKLCRKAKGHVLEVSAGTGRNMQFYDVDAVYKAERGKPSNSVIESITFVDQSPKMMDLCREQWTRLDTRIKGRVQFLVADAGSPNAINTPPSSDGYDTIIQTFGLCSTQNPAQYLARVGQLLKRPDGKGSEGGRIYLLEHGRGHYVWLNSLLDGLAKGHADRFGCWWNRDIGKIVEESGLNVVDVKRRHFGTTWIFELSLAEGSN